VGEAGKKYMDSTLERRKDMKSDWVPVENSLPEPYETVLLTAYHVAGEPPLVYQGARNGKDEWQLYGVENPQDYIITSWMPQPQPYRSDWTPIEEGLPGRNGTYLCQIRHNYAKDGWVAWRVYDYTVVDNRFIGLGNLCYVEAWRELPEMYKNV
jgi:hypothetical protein